MNQTASPTTLAEAITQTTCYAHTRALIPETHVTSFLGAVARLRAASDELGIDTVDQLLDARVGDRAIRALVCQAAGVSGFNSFHSADNLDALHLHRNTLAAIVAVHGRLHGAKPSALLASFPAPQSRGLGLGRALRSDELVLGRIVALEALERGTERSQTRAGYWLLGDAGLTPPQSTALLTGDIDDPVAPTQLRVPGVGNTHEHVVALDAFGLQGLPIYLQNRALRDPDVPLVYDGKHQPGAHQSTPTVHGVIERTFLAAGLQDPDLTAKSLPGAALLRTVEQGRLGDAKRLRGVNSLDRVRSALNVARHVVEPKSGPVAGERRIRVSEMAQPETRR